MKRTIPQIRAQLYRVADCLRDLMTTEDFDADEVLILADQIDALARETIRRSSGKRAAPTARRLTPELADRIRAFVERHPDMTNREIGARFGVDGGRVTDAMLGIRGQEAGL